MRLAVISKGGQRKFKHRLRLLLIRFLMGDDASDVMATLTYRPDYFGSPFSDLVHELLRGESSWSFGERELFAAFTSSANECFF